MYFLVIVPLNNIFPNSFISFAILHKFSHKNSVCSSAAFARRAPTCRCSSLLGPAPLCCLHFSVLLQALKPSCIKQQESPCTRFSRSQRCRGTQMLGACCGRRSLSCKCWRYKIPLFFSSGRWRRESAAQSQLPHHRAGSVCREGVTKERGTQGGARALLGTGTGPAGPQAASPHGFGGHCGW